MPIVNTNVVPGFSQFLRITPEASYGTFNGAGTPTWVRLTGDNAFNPTKTVYKQTLRSADTYNRRVTNVFNPSAIKYSVAASLATPLYPSLAAFYLGAATTLTGTVGAGTAPNLGSYTFDFFNGAVVRRYLGGMCESLSISSDAEGQTAMIGSNWVFQSVDDSKTLTDVPVPASTVFASEPPYVHSELTGNFLLATSPGTPALIAEAFDHFSLSIKNTLVHGFFDAPTITFCQFAGHDVDMTTNLTYSTTDWRGYYESQSAVSVTIEFLRSSVAGHLKSLLFNFETSSFISDRSESRPLGGIVTQGATLQSYFDTANSSDFSYTAQYTA